MSDMISIKLSYPIPAIMIPHSTALSSLVIPSHKSVEKLECPLSKYILAFSSQNLSGPGLLSIAITFLKYSY